MGSGEADSPHILKIQLYFSLFMNDWKPSDGDAYLLSIENGLISYYYAIKADLKNQGTHYYKEDNSGELKEVQEQEILDLLKTPDKIFHKCPCLRVGEDGHLVPFIVRTFKRD